VGIRIGPGFSCVKIGIGIDVARRVDIGSGVDAGIGADPCIVVIL